MLNKYNVFMVVYKLRNFSKAAIELCMTQPAVSYSIRDLENQLNIKLFHRIHNGVIPTEEGKELYKYINDALNTISLGEKRIKEFSGLKTGTIRIGIPSHIGIFFLNNYIKKFNRKYKNIKFEIVCRSISDMSKMLEMKLLDIIMESRPICTNRNDIVINLLQEFHYCFIANKNSYDRNFSVEEISKCNLIVPNLGAPARKEIDLFFKQRNIEIDPLMEVWTSEMILDLVKKDIGVGYFIKEFLRADDDLKVIEFNDLPKISVYIAYIPEFQSVASNNFIKILEEE